jgi:PAS domain S-box-containing protein
MKPGRNPLAFFYNLKIGVKILIGYITALALAAVIGGLAIFQLNRVNTTVTRLTGHLSAERDLAEQMAVQIYRIRLYANRYINQGQDPAVLASYDQALAYAQTLLDEGDQVITEGSRIAMQATVHENFDQFTAAFTEIVQLLSERQELESNVLEPQYARSLEKLAVIRNNSIENLDLTSANFASQARDTISQMEVNVCQYLATGNEQYASQVDMNFEAIQSTLDLLNASVSGQSSRDLVGEISAAIATYHEGFLKIHSLAAQQRDKTANQLDIYGAAVDQNTTEIANSVNQEFTTQSQKTNQLVGQTRLRVLVTIACVVAAGLAFGMLLSRVITRPIQHLARAAQGISAGALDQKVPVQSNDELGILAEAFNHMADRMHGTMAELQQSLASLQASQERQRLILETSPFAILISRFDGTILYANQHFTDQFGTNVDQTVMKTADFYIDSAERQQVLDIIHQQGYLDDYELRVRKANGNPAWVYLSARQFKFDEETVLLSTLIDITTRKQTEIALHEAQQLYENIFRLSPELIVVTSEKDGRYLAASESHERITGYRADEVIGHQVGEFLIWETPGDPEKMLQILREQGAVHNLETRFHRRSGELYTALLSMARVEVGGEQCLVSIVTDITERKRIDEEVRRLNTELERRVIERTEQLEIANQELESFSYSVSHDLRAPLRAIDGFSRILQDEFPDLSADASRLIHSVRSNAQQMGKLIDDLLRFSRLNRQPLNKRNVDMTELVRRALQTLESEREGRQVEITLGELPACQGDPSLLLQVWVNLLSNALKFTRRREVAQIKIACQNNEHEEAVYFVRDNGVGFNMQYAGKLFGVFQRLHRTDEFEGTGVGLALVQRIIQRHGGRIWAQAVPEAGATFSFTVGNGE